MVSLHSLSLALDHVLDRTVLPGFSALGHAVRRR
ncbi:MAG: dehydrogenase, partial [Actinobacteria bacterium]|nr:dehydrogenase [Actinomycetota bacterium]